MNQSLNYIKGKYLVFLNAGDTFNSPSDLFTIYNEINQNPDYGLYYCDYKTTGLDKRVYSPKRLHKFTLFRNMLCHQCCFFQIDKFRVTGFFNTKYKVVADYDFLLRFIILNKFCSKHIDLLGIISKSGGYASLNQRKSKQEVEMIRREIFGNKYFINNLLLEMTFPSLRNRLMTSKSLIVKHFYLDIINFINQKV
jgi:glycosyltransferase involved in cell wall biosynthesis